MTATTHPTAFNLSPRLLSGLCVLLFLIACVYDPADKILGAKVWIFLLCWFFAVDAALKTKQTIKVSSNFIIYIYIFILIPTLSVFGYLIGSGNEAYNGPAYLKGYVLITFALLLVLLRISILQALSAILTSLSILIIATYLLIEINPDLYALLYVAGEITGLLQLDNAREYGEGVVLNQVYFVTSPMIVVAIANYFHQAHAEVVPKMKIRYSAVMLINILAMIVAGSRNNILIAFALPMLLVILTSRRKISSIFLLAILIFSLIAFYFQEVRAFFDPNEISNSVKIILIEDYEKIFKDIRIIFLGQGLGSFHNFEGRGMLPVTELTYHEMIRSFGVIGALIMFVLLLIPVWSGFFHTNNLKFKCLTLAYLCYLIMSASNPLLFSSMGMLILSMMLAEMQFKSFKS